MRVRVLAAGLCLAAFALAMCGCAEEPRVQEDLPVARPWFEVVDVEVKEDGIVTVSGELVAEVGGVAQDTSAPTGTADPGVFPEHIAYGLWPEPDEIGGGDAVDVSEDGSFVFEYDFSRPDGIRRGWHVLQFDKAGWGSQYIWVNVAAQEWSETVPQ